MSQRRQPSTTTSASGEGVGGAGAAGGGGPMVVIGLTGHTGDGASGASGDSGDERSSLETRAEARAEAAPSTLRHGTGRPGRSTQPAAQPALELVGEAERLELVREQSLELVRESLELVRETLDAEMASSGARQVAESTEPTFELIESERLPHTTSLPTPSEISIPPAGDLAVEPIADRFFSEGELVAAGSHDEDWDDAADKVQRKSLPHVVERRARFAKYVRWAVGGAAIVCVAALARTTIYPSSRVAAAAAPAGAAVTDLQLQAPPVEKAAPPPAAAAPAKTAEPAPVAVAVAPAAEAPSVEAPNPEARVSAPKVDVPAAPPPSAASGQVTTAAPTAPAAPGDKTAMQEKNDARRALERGKLADSIAAGERSVALDPTDGEAWLLLGAAYQEKGKNAEARRCYAACLKEGKRGPVGECRAMLR